LGVLGWRLEIRERETLKFSQKFWLGEKGLALTFWVVFVVGGFIVRGGAAYLFFQYRSAYVPLILLSTAYFIYSFVCVWRSANHYEGSKGWAVASKVVVALAALPTLAILANVFIDR
jgi:hypothetical protein